MLMSDDMTLALLGPLENRTAEITHVNGATISTTRYCTTTHAHGLWNDDDMTLVRAIPPKIWREKGQHMAFMDDRKTV